MKEGYIGLAGELRVMSELLLQGHNPAKSYLDNGIDLFLETGKKLQIRSGHIRKTDRYEFPVNKQRYGVHKKKELHISIDFLIIWCINDNEFFIFPREIVKNKATICIVPNKIRKRNSWYEQYRNKWELLL
jgi:hypothetical protein